MGDEQLAEQVRSARFPVTRMRRGYDMGEVDAFLDRLVDAIDADEALRPLVDAALFRAVRSGGYDEQAVDRFLDQVVAGQEAGRGAPPAAPPVAPPVAPSAPRVAGEPLPTAVQEQKGLLARLFGR